MQKKINILSILLMISLFFGVASTCADPNFKEGFKEGAEMTRETHIEDTGVTSDAQTTDEGRQITVTLARKDIHQFGEEVVNIKTGDVLPTSIQKAAMVIKSPKPSSWLLMVLLIPLLPGVFFFICLLISFISRIKEGDIFTIGNEWKLRWMAGIALYWGLAEWIIDLVEYSFVKSAVEFQDYTVCFDKPSIMPFILALTFLLFAEIFALGRKMKEDQEFMV